MSTAGHKWKRLQPALARPPSEELISAWLQAHPGRTREQILKIIADDLAKVRLFRNDLYQVEVRRLDAGFVQICIRRLDGFIGRDWRHFQQIKNEIVGAECEAVEIYPAESRLVDTSNKFHLFACTDPTFRFPFGWEQRDVQYGADTVPGLRQRPPMVFAEEIGEP